MPHDSKESRALHVHLEFCNYFIQARGAFTKSKTFLSRDGMEKCLIILVAMFVCFLFRFIVGNFF